MIPSSMTVTERLTCELAGVDPDDWDEHIIVEQGAGYDPVVVSYGSDLVQISQRFADELIVTPDDADMLGLILKSIHDQEPMNDVAPQWDAPESGYTAVILYKGFDQGNSGDWVVRVMGRDYSVCIKGNGGLDELSLALSL